MASSEQLFTLIKSMSKSEKRNFKIFSSRHVIGDKSNYIDLFDAIDNQTDYNETKILKKFTGQKLSSNLSSVKVQLSKLILRSLRQNNLTNKKRYDVRMYLDYIDILFEKGLYDQSKKMLKKARKIASDYGFNISLDEIALYEYRIAMQEGNYEDLCHFVEVTFPESVKIRTINAQLAVYDRILAELKCLVINSNRTGHIIEATTLDKIVDHAMLHNSPDDLPFEGRVEYHTVWGYYHHIKSDFPKALYHRETVLKILEEKPEIVFDLPSLWLYSARLLLISLGNAKMYGKLDEKADQVKKFVGRIEEAKNTQHIKSEVYTTIYNIKLDTDIDRGRFASGAVFAKEVEENLKFFANQIDPNAEMVLHYNLFYVYFGNQEYRTALKWLNRLLDFNYHWVRVDIQCFSRVVNIILHYELANYELIDSLVRSTERFLIKKERKYQIETTFLKFARRHLQEPYTTNKRDDFRILIDDIEEIMKDNALELRTLEYFEIQLWLLSKVENKSFGKLVKEKSVRMLDPIGIL